MSGGDTASPRRRATPQAVPRLEEALQAVRLREAELREENDRLAAAALEAERERRRYQRIFEAAAFTYVITDGAGLVREASRTAGGLLGVEPEDLVGTHLADWLEPASRPEYLRLLGSGIPPGDGGIDVVLVPRRGEPLPAALRAASASPDAPDGERLWVLRDLRERLRAEENERSLFVEKAARAASQEAARQATFLAEAARTLSRVLRFDEVARTVAELAVPMLGDFCVVDAMDPGQGARRIAAVHRDEALADVMDHLRRQEPKPGAGTPFGRVMGGGEPEVITDPGPDDLRGFEPRDLRVLQRLTARELLVLPLRARGGVVGTLTLGAASLDRRLGAQVLFAQAFADRAAFALDNARLYADALEASAAKSEFIGMISHEFRTPLTAVVGFAELLESGTAGPLNEKQGEYAHRVRMAAWHLSQLVDEVLAFARLEAGRLEVRLAQVDACEVVRNAAGVLRTGAERKGLALRLDLPESALIVTDEGKLRQILLNLLGNAIKFTRAGHVAVRVRRQSDAVHITVSDTGPGIPPDDHEHVFERFWQGDRLSAGGAGIGLAVVSGLVRLLGGDVELESELGSGSTFTVTLPVNGPPPPVT